MKKIVLWKIRDKQGLSLRQLEKLTGISGTQLNMYERGLISPTMEKLEWIAEALHVAVADLYEDE